MRYANLLREKLPLDRIDDRQHDFVGARFKRRQNVPDILCLQCQRYLIRQLYLLLLDHTIFPMANPISAPIKTQPIRTGTRNFCVVICNFKLAT